ncbi:hypothetical protein ABZ154_24455 [Streptomyces sp. NPDC006261]|uniref:hypothetical protein n=1 Tax=Streptomyces sp. NPDC006261 TaxID=3156739 RepID=UPI0033BAE9D3
MVAISDERRYGTLGAVLLSPRHRTPFWIGGALPYVLDSLLISALTLTAASLLLGLPIPLGALPGLTAALLAAAAGCPAFGPALLAVYERGGQGRSAPDVM